MRELDVKEITRAVAQLFVEANRELPCDLVSRIEESAKKETDPLGSGILQDLVENLAAAKALHIPICQDTGMAVLFVDLGQEVHLTGGLLEDAVNEGVRQGYVDGLLRCSVVSDPLKRKNTGDNTPAILHLRLVPGDQVTITAAPKGFGSENMSAIKMFTPSATREDILNFVIGVVKQASSNPCPPMVVGVGIGGDFEYCAYLAKKALCRSVSQQNEDPYYAEMERELLHRINALGIGPQGFGGDTTALAVQIEPYPTHIAGLPVAVNIGCHVTRHKKITI